MAVSGVFASSANAGVKDQEQPNADASQIVFPEWAVAQTFRAGIAGRLDEAELRLYAVPGCESNPNPTIELRRTAGGAPGALMASDALAPLTNTGAEGQDFRAMFNPKPAVSVGGVYALVARATNCDYAWTNSYDGAPYAFGEPFYANDLGNPSDWTAWNSGADHTFATFVRPASCGGKPATIASDAKTVAGTARRDVIFAYGGADKVVGRGGNDVLCGDTGNDVLKGGPGKDRMLGGRGRDKCVGGPGKDSGRSCEIKKSF